MRGDFLGVARYSEKLLCREQSEQMGVDARTESTGGRKDCDFGHGFGGILELR